MIIIFLSLAISSLHLKPRYHSRRKPKSLKNKQSKSEEEGNSNNDLEAIEALLARRYPKGKGKYKGKIPLIYFSCQVWTHCYKMSKQRRQRWKEAQQVQRQEGFQELQGLQIKR